MKLPSLASHVRYEVSGRPRGGLGGIVARLERHRFVPLGDDVEQEEAWGWITLEHLLDVQFRPDKIELGPYVVFGLRRDRRKAPAALVRAHVRQQELAHREATGRWLAARERRELREQVRETLVRKVLPSASSWPVVWHRGAACLWFGTASQRANEMLVGLFRETFELELTRLGPGALAARLLEGDEQAWASLARLEPTAFVAAGSRPALAASA
ncbi:MAG: hypothetical protein D6776_02910 [Planctomycetota bacterium]|nr:MAG: hypothetical protein D6776_02910 [Planctomycetota bacterium]